MLLRKAFRMALLGFPVVLLIVAIVGRCNADRISERIAYGQTSLPNAARNVTLQNGEFDISVDGIFFEESRNTGGTTAVTRNYWSNRGLDGGKAVRFAFNVDHVQGAERARSAEVLPNICQVEARFRSRQGTGPGSAFDGFSPWQVINWAAWDNASLVIAGGGTTAQPYGGGFQDAAAYLRGGVVIGQTPGGRPESWNQQYENRKLQGRLILPEDGDWDGADREYHFEFRFIWGTGSTFAGFYNATRGGRSDAQWLAQWPPPDAAANNACSFYTQDLKTQAQDTTNRTEISIESMIPSFSSAARGTLRTLGDSDGVRVVLIPGASYPICRGRQRPSTEFQWRYLQSCGNQICGVLCQDIAE